MKQPDFVISLNIPITVPTEEEAEAVRPNLEPHQIKLMEENHLTLVELVSYMRFAVDLASFAPFFLDEYLKVFRANVNKETEVEGTGKEVPESRIITPF